MTTRGIAVLFVLVSGLGLAGCGGGGGGSVASWCRLVKSDQTKLNNAGTSADGLAALKKVESSAPSAIKGDVKTVEKLIESASPTHPPSGSDLAKAQTAGTNITKYVKDNCKIDLNAGT